MFGTRFAFPALAAAVAVTLFQTAAFAETGQAPTAQVSYAGLDLATADGQRKLDGRIDRAVSEVCLANNTRSVSEQRLERACKAETRAAIAVLRDQLVANAMAGQTRTADVGEDKPAVN
jgi:UrcA family protein